MAAKLLVFTLVCMPKIASAQQSLEFSGFLSINGGIIDDEEGLDFSPYSEDLTFQNNIIGLQAQADLDEDISATIQLTSRGTNDYDVDIEWAYISWEFSEQQQLRAGRLRTPLYLLSDFLDVGYAIPWVQAPSTVYYLPANNFDGIDYIGRFLLNDFDFSLQAYFGGYDQTFSVSGLSEGIKSESRNQMGVAATIGRDIWKIRAAYHQADIANDLTPLFGDLQAALNAAGFIRNANLLQQTEDNASRFVQVGYEIDTGRFIGSGEYIEFEVEDSYFSKDKRAYVLAGYRTGDWLFHVTYGWSDDTSEDFAGGIPDVPQTQPLLTVLNGLEASQTEEQSIWTLGTRWDVKPGVAVKIQWDEAEDKFSGEEQTALSFALQAVF